MKKLLVLVALFSLSTLGIAQDGPCKPDIEKFCKDVKGGKEIAKCLKSNEAGLSAECKAKKDAKVSEIKTKILDIKDKCSADKLKFCKDVKIGKGAVIKCLKENEKQLTPECAATLPVKK